MFCSATYRLLGRWAAPAMLLCVAATASAAGPCTDCLECSPRVAVKTNLLYDAAITPDIGIEVSLARQWSVLAVGQRGWWGSETSTHCWRIAGGSLALQRWWGTKARERALTGHHGGIYGNAHKFDLEFGHRGHQSADWCLGGGILYGYSIRLAHRLNLDMGVRAGYLGGRVIHYKPMCGKLVETSRSRLHYWGITGLEVSLVWFPGRGRHNNPDY